LKQFQLEDSILSWSVHLIARQPGRPAQIGAVLLAVLALGICLFHSFWISLIPVLALLFSLSEFVFPVRYTLTKQSASVRHGLTSLEIRWADVHHAYLTDDGIKLSPLQTKNSRFESLRGVFLRFDDQNREAVIGAVRRLWQEQAPSV
jgi:ABC-type long-subunit fatty acid transport system fused permease/ATPase subunit